ncbi:MAG: hypothetical protein GY863_10500 [bacterium]|nr:hypothetical protein [bacterium]
MSTARENILSRIRNAEKKATGVSSAINNIKSQDTLSEHELIEKFSKELLLVSGEFHLMKNIEETAEIISKILIESSINSIYITGEDLCTAISSKIDKKTNRITFDDIGQNDFKNSIAGIPASLVRASYAIADTGTLAFIYDDCGNTLPHFLPECIFAVIEKSRLLPDQVELFEKVSPDEAKNMVFVTGPSRTADIEKVLVLGAHGPKRLIVLMMENE